MAPAWVTVYFVGAAVMLMTLVSFRKSPPTPLFVIMIAAWPIVLAIAFVRVILIAADLDE